MDSRTSDTTTYLTSLLVTLVNTGCLGSPLRNSTSLRSGPELTMRYWSVARTGQEQGGHCRLDITGWMSGLTTTSSTEDEDKFLNQIEN